MENYNEFHSQNSEPIGFHLELIETKSVRHVSPLYVGYSAQKISAFYMSSTQLVSTLYGDYNSLNVL